MDAWSVLPERRPLVSLSCGQTMANGRTPRLHCSSNDLRDLLPASTKNPDPRFENLVDKRLWNGDIASRPSTGLRLRQSWQQRPPARCDFITINAPYMTPSAEPLLNTPTHAQLEHILNHEQGHMDVSEAYAKVARAELKSMRFTFTVWSPVPKVAAPDVYRNLAAKLLRAQAIQRLSDLNGLMNKTQTRYEKETKSGNHGNPHAGQTTWTTALAQTLANAEDDPNQILVQPVEARVKRWLRFKLRLCFLLVSGVAIACAFVGMRVRYYQRQEALVTYLASLGVRANCETDRTDALTSAILGGRHRVVTDLNFSQTHTDQRHSIDDLLIQMAKLDGLNPEWVSIVGNDPHKPLHLGVDGLHALSKFDRLANMSLLFVEVSREGFSKLDLVPRLEYLSLPGSVRDEDLAAMPPLLSLHTLHVANAYVTDSGTQHLAKHVNLREVHLDHTAVSNEGATRLKAALPNAIHVGGTDDKNEVLDRLQRQIHDFQAGTRKDVEISSLLIRDEDLKPLSQLTGIAGLSLSYTAVTGEALSFLSSPTELKSLDLSSCPALSNDAFASIKNFSSLRVLNLSETAVGPAAVMDLVDNLPKLEELYLDNCRIDDAVMPSMHSLKHLQLLSLDGTQVTADAIERIYEVRPDLIVVGPRE